MKLELIHTLFESHALNHPDAPAIITPNRTLSYAELNQRADQLARYLQLIGVKPDTLVALALHRSIDQLITLLAVLKAGGAYVPLDPTQPKQRLLSLIDNHQIPFLITSQDLAGLFEAEVPKLITFNSALGENLPPLEPINIRDHHLAYVIFTSGSTGEPKGVMIEHRTVINFCQAFNAYAQSYPLQRFDFSGNYAFDMAIGNTLIPLMLGATIVLCEDVVKKDLRDFLRFLQKYQVNLLKITPSYFNALLYEVKNNRVDLPHLQVIILGGEQLGKADCVTWQQLYPHHRLLNEYGPTETTVAVSTFSVTPQSIGSVDSDNIPIGKPEKNMAFYLLDEHKNAVALGEKGELYIGGKCLARGYLNQPQLTDEKFIRNPFNADERLYKTGDICYQKPDGNYEYIGRVDHQVKIRGFRIELSEIDQHVLKMPTIKNAITLAQETAAKEKQLVVYYVLEKDNEAISYASWQQHLKMALPDYMIPRIYIKLTELPLNANGKLDRKALPLPQTIKHSHATQDNAAHALIAIWEDELGVSAIESTDNFFELGGHSLAAARIVSRVRQELQKEITLSDLYNHPTPQTLWQILDEKQVFIPQEISFKEPNQLALTDFQLLLWLTAILAPSARKLNIVGRKRFKKALNQHALSFAFDCLMQKHKLLHFHVSKWKPLQYKQTHALKIHEKSLRHLSPQMTETILSESFIELGQYYPWPKHTPALLVRLFYLDDEYCELQLCLPHMIADGYSATILFSDLSKYYSMYENGYKNIRVTSSFPYSHLLEIEEKNHVNFQRDQAFWTDYLADTPLFEFPKKFIAHKTFLKPFHYSTYVKLPSYILKELPAFCMEQHLTLNDVLCASLAYSLQRYAKQASIAINCVKSTRHDTSYDELIGCFLKIEPLKVTFNTDCDVLDYAQQIHQSMIDTANYQDCSNLIKLASVNPHPAKISRLKQRLIQWSIHLYTRLFSSLKLNKSVLQLLEKLAVLNKRKRFMINLNVWNNFLSDDTQTLFNTPVVPLNDAKDDLLSVDYILDVCFIRHNNLPYLVISGNLQEAFRRQLAESMIGGLAECCLVEVRKVC